MSPEAAADPRVRLKWADAPVGDHELSLQVGPLPDDVDVTNNQITLHVHVHTNTLYLPLMGRD